MFSLWPLFVACLVCAWIVLVSLVWVMPRVSRMRERIRQHDARARANRRIRALAEAQWRDLERRAEFRAGLHRKLTGRA